MNAECQNTEGSYNCTCKDGFHGNGTNCTGECSSETLVVRTGEMNFIPMIITLFFDTYLVPWAYANFNLGSPQKSHFSYTIFLFRSTKIRLESLGILK